MKSHFQVLPQILNRIYWTLGHSNTNMLVICNIVVLTVGLVWLYYWKFYFVLLAWTVSLGG